MSASLQRTFWNLNANEESSWPARELIVASAGSGKTHELTNRCLRALIDGVPPERMLAATFTRKAAGEILDRVLSRLAEAASDTKGAAKLAEQLKRPDLTRPRCVELLRDVLKRLHRLRVGTLDSFFVKAAGAYALEFGLPLGWTVIDPLDESRLRDEAIAATLDGGDVETLARLFILLAKGEATRDVAGMLRREVSDLHEIFRSTPASAWSWLAPEPGLAEKEITALRRDLAIAPLPKHKTIAEERDDDVELIEGRHFRRIVERGIGKAVANHDGEGPVTYRGKEIPETTVAIYRKLLQQTRHEVVKRTAEAQEAAFELLSRYDVEHRRLCRERRVLRFSDVPRGLSDAFDDAGAARVIGGMSFRLDARIERVLLDEFQDTSLPQWKVMRAFVKSALSSPRGAFFCVGDPKQAIYGWRGGRSALLESIPREIPDMDVQRPATSRRSSQAVIDAVNAVFCGGAMVDHHGNLGDKEEPIARWCKRFPFHTTVKSTLPGHVTLEVGPEGAQGRDGQAPFLDFAAERVAELANSAPGATVGVLVRRNETVGQLIYRLRARGIAASEEGGSTLLDSPAVELILSLLTLADHPGDTAAKHHVAMSPLGESLSLRTEASPEETARFADKLRQRLVDEGYGRCVHAWAQLLADDCDRRDRQRLQQLVESAYGYDAVATLRTKTFRDRIADQKVEDPSASRVRVMTVHQSKGLEFDVVVLPELDGPLGGHPPAFWVERESEVGDVMAVCRYVPKQEVALMPDRVERMRRQYLAERVDDALCVLYVALTRAVHGLHMLVRPHDQEPLKKHSGLLRAALLKGAPLNAGERHSLFGDANWHARLPVERRREMAAGEQSQAPVAVEVVRLAAPSAEQKRGLMRAAPSSLEGGGLIPVDRLLGLADDHDPTAMLRGGVFHKCYEQIVWLDQRRPTREELHAAVLAMPDIDDVEEKRLDEWIDLCLKSLDRPNLAALLSSTEYARGLPTSWPTAFRDKFTSKRLQATARNEWPFARRSGQELRQGRIDRLVTLRDGDKVVAAEVIDFKTDRVSEERGRTLEERVAFYRPQVTAYRETVAASFGLSPEAVAVRLAFVACDLVAGV